MLPFESPLALTAALGVLVWLSDWLARKTFLRHLGTALLVIVLTAVAANSGVVPTYSSEVEVYSIVFSDVAYLGIFWLLLEVRLARVLRAGGSMIALFLLGCLGTTVGVLVALQVVGGSDSFGPLTHALAGMFVGTYTGGSINYNAVALEYGVQEEASLFAGAAAVDSLMTTIWMAITLMVPRWMGSRRSQPSAAELPALDAPTNADDDPDQATIGPAALARVLALGLAGVAAGRWLAAELEQAFSVSVPSILVITTLALILAQFRAVAELPGARLLGMLAVYIFLAVIGALCDVAALQRIGELGGRLLLFVTVTLIVHGTVVFGAAKLFRQDPDMAAVASQGGIGGGTTALALARSLGRPDLVLPAILIGSLGSAVGTYLGLATAGWLAP